MGCSGFERLQSITQYVIFSFLQIMHSSLWVNGRKLRVNDPNAFQVMSMNFSLLSSVFIIPYMPDKTVWPEQNKCVKLYFYSMQAGF